jgi:hypothetical protein
MDWIELVVSIVSFVVAIGSIAYTASHTKKTGVLLATHQANIDKELTQFQHALQLESQRNFEQFRSSLEVQIIENRWIRERRFAIIQELYSLIAESLYISETIVAPKTGNLIPLVGGLAEDLKAAFEGEGKGAFKGERAFTLATLLSNFSKSYLKHRVILSRETCEVIDIVHSDAAKLVGPLFASLLKDGHNPKDEKHVQVVEFLESKSNELVATFKVALSAFEEEARKVLPEGK